MTMWIQIDPEAVETGGIDYIRERIAHYAELEQDANVAKYRAAAERQDGELEVDPDAVVSMGDDPGAYVMSWQWVTDEDAGIERGAN
jgi:hypothetical protein